jgi:hypothetical protein
LLWLGHLAFHGVFTVLMSTIVAIIFATVLEKFILADQRLTGPDGLVRPDQVKLRDISDIVRACQICATKNEKLYFADLNGFQIYQ